MRRLGLFLVLLIAIPRIVATQNQPDFSGEWVARPNGRVGSANGALFNQLGGIIGGGGVQTRYSVFWEGDRLVIETGSYSGPGRQDGPYSEHTEEWRLDREGLLILQLTDRSDKEQTSNTLTYRRN